MILVSFSRRWVARLSHAMAALALSSVVAGCFGDDDSFGFDVPIIPDFRAGEGTVAFQVAPAQSEFTVSVDGTLLDVPVPSAVVVSGDMHSLTVEVFGADATIDYSFPDPAGTETHDVAVTWNVNCFALIVDGEKVRGEEHAGVLGFADPQSVMGESSVTALKVFGREMDEEEIEIVQNGGTATLVAARGFVSAEQVDGSFCIQLGTGGVGIAATEHDLSWDSSCLTLVEGSCDAAAASVSLTTTHENESTLRVNVESTEDGASLPNGSLYCCSFIAELGDSTGCCPISLENATALDLDESEISIGAVDGGVCHADGIERTCS